MKTLNKVTVLSLAALLLASCSGSGVSAEEFSKKASEVEAHQYNSAVVTYSEKSSIGGSDTDSSGRIEYTFGDSGWTTESEDENADELVEMLSMNVKAFNVQDMQMEEMPKEAEMNIKYYINPFKVTANAKYNASTEGGKTDLKFNSEFVFDKYGYLVKNAVDFYMSIDAEVLGQKISTVISTKTNVSISYK